MRIVIEDFKSEHYQLITEMAKALEFQIVEVEVDEDEEEAYLLASREEGTEEPNETDEEIADFRSWLKSSGQNKTTGNQ